MSTQQLVLHTLPNLLTKAPEVINLSVPRFDTEDEAIEYLTILAKTKSLANWETSYLLASITTEYGDSTFARACEEAGIDPGTGGRLRWLGQTWPVDLVRQFGGLTHKHFSEVTALMNDLYAKNDQIGIEKLVDVLWQANVGYQKPNGKITPYSSAWVKREAYMRVNGTALPTPAQQLPGPALDIEEGDVEGYEEEPDVLPRPTTGRQASRSVIPDDNRVTVRGQLFHDPAIPMDNGTTRPAIVIMLEDIPSMKYLVEQLTTNGLYGQYVSASIRVDDVE